MKPYAFFPKDMIPSGVENTLGLAGIGGFSCRRRSKIQT
jgi:hypothetical protein